jgi:hypothetical protein
MVEQAVRLSTPEGALLSCLSQGGKGSFWRKRLSEADGYLRAVVLDSLLCDVLYRLLASEGCSADDDRMGIHRTWMDAAPGLYCWVSQASQPSIGDVLTRRSSQDMLRWRLLSGESRPPHGLVTSAIVVQASGRSPSFTKQLLVGLPSGGGTCPTLNRLEHLSTAHNARRIPFSSSHFPQNPCL